MVTNKITEEELLYWLQKKMASMKMSTLEELEEYAHDTDNFEEADEISFYLTCYVYCVNNKDKIVNKDN